jgi:ribokinase
MPAGAAPDAQPRAICVVGSLNADLVVRAPRAPAAGETVRGTGHARFAGGKGGNQAVAAARLAGAGARVSLIGRVGDDEHGRWLRDQLAAAGVDGAGVGSDPQLPTGLAAITVEDGGQNRIIVVPGANDGLTPGQLSRNHAVLTSAGVLLLQLEIPLPTVQTAARMGREKRAVVVLDPAPTGALPDSLLALCDYLTPNEAELAALCGLPAGGDAWPLDDVAAAARRLLARGARSVIVKLGARGALLVNVDGAQHWPPFAVAAVDTTAAGDAFNAGLAVALAAGAPLQEAGRFACAAGALAVTRPGAQPSLPARAEVDALLGSATD